MISSLPGKRFALATALGTLCLADVSSTPAAVTFAGVFAPEDSVVKPAEKPFRQDLCLNGTWQFQPVPLPDSFKESQDPTPALPPVDPARWDAVPIRVPSPWNVNAFTEKNGEQAGGDFHTFPSYPKAWEKIKLGWLRKPFTVPADWQPGRRLFLHFDAVAGEAQVFVNGRPVGIHTDIFLPFDLDVTDAVKPGGVENELLVGVRKASLFDQKSDHGRRTYQGGSFWGQFAAGIWQDVFLVAVPAVRASNVYLDPQVDKDSLEASITLTNDGDKETTVKTTGTVFPWNPRSTHAGNAGDPVPSVELGKEALMTLPSIETKVPAHGQITVGLSRPPQGKLKPWTPAQPNLYALVVSTTGAGGKPIDASYTRFGWRQWTFRGSEMLLNGEPIILHGDSWHFMGVPQMTRRYPWAWFTALHDAGLNAVRLHAEPYPAFYLDVADEMGICVLDETAMWASDGGPKLDSPAYWKDSEAHLSSLVLRDRNHPAVFGWSVSNEIVPIVKGVMRNPPGMLDELLKHYTIWADICRKLDPSRPWISADGEDDGQGRLPTYVVHYGGTDAQKRAAASGKPWGVGEAGNAYYGTPEQVSQQTGPGGYERAYQSFEGRMEGVAISSYDNLVNQRESHATYRSVFNLVWYGLEPLTLGMPDTTHAPAGSDGILFPNFQEGRPGVQPERLGPYCTTLNPGYDPSLPLYKPWPLFEAIRDAAVEPPVKGKWSAAPTAATPEPPQAAKLITTLQVLSGTGGQLAAQLGAVGLPVAKSEPGGVPQLLFIDGAHPPAPETAALIKKVLASGDTVFVWGADPISLPTLNALLPAPLELTDRKASSLVLSTPDRVTVGLLPSGMYFSEQRPAEITTHGLAGPLVAGGSVFLQACDTDWQQWNKRPEETKTAMILRSERESKPSGAVLVAAAAGKGGGRLLVTTLPSAPRSVKAEKLVRTVLSNLGVTLGTGMDAGKPLLKNGNLVRALAAGNFPVPSVQEGAAIDAVKPASGNDIHANAEAAPGKKWKSLFQENGIIDLTKLGLSGPAQNAEAYLSFWVFSPRSLEDLLLEPNLPSVGFETTQNDAVQAWLNGAPIINKIRTGPADGGKAEARDLKLKQGWNHVLIKLIHQGGGWEFTGRFTCNQPEFLGQMDSALEKP